MSNVKSPTAQFTITDCLARSTVKGQASVSIYEMSNGQAYMVGYGMQETIHMTLKAALNDYNQCCLHAETCAGWHE